MSLSSLRCRLGCSSSGLANTSVNTLLSYIYCYKSLSNNNEQNNERKNLQIYLLVENGGGQRPLGVVHVADGDGWEGDGSEGGGGRGETHDDGAVVPLVVQVRDVVHRREHSQDERHYPERSVIGKLI